MFFKILRRVKVLLLSVPLFLVIYISNIYNTAGRGGVRAENYQHKILQAILPSTVEEDAFLVDMDMVMAVAPWTLASSQ